MISFIKSMRASAALENNEVCWTLVKVCCSTLYLGRRPGPLVVYDEMKHVKI